MKVLSMTGIPFVAGMGACVTGGTGNPRSRNWASDISVAEATSSNSVMFHVDRISKFELEYNENRSFVFLG